MMCCYVTWKVRLIDLLIGIICSNRKPYLTLFKYLFGGHSTEHVLGWSSSGWLCGVEPVHLQGILHRFLKCLLLFLQSSIYCIFFHCIWWTVSVLKKRLITHSCVSDACKGSKYQLIKWIFYGFLNSKKQMSFLTELRNCKVFFFVWFFVSATIIRRV